MTVEAMQEVAQGRVWTGKQALQFGLIDDLGGFWKALELASKLSGLDKARLRGKVKSLLSNSTSSQPFTVNIQTLKEPRAGLNIPFIGRNLQSSSSKPVLTLQELVEFTCDDAIYMSGLILPESGKLFQTLLNEGFKCLNSPALANQNNVQGRVTDILFAFLNMF
jgi:hypothetical protein